MRSERGEFAEGTDRRMDELEEIMANILVRQPGDLPPESTPLRDIRGWDSLQHVLLVVGLEKRLNTQLTAEEIRRLVTLADVRHLIKQKGADA